MDNSKWFSIFKIGIFSIRYMVCIIAFLFFSVSSNKRSIILSLRKNNKVQSVLLFNQNEVKEFWFLNIFSGWLMPFTDSVYFLSLCCGSDIKQGISRKYVKEGKFGFNVRRVFKICPFEKKFFLLFLII